jgi:WD40 repeat protein
MKKHFQIMKAKDKQGRKTAVTTCCFSRDGKLVAGAGLDGSIQIWNAKGPLVKPTYHQTSAHVQGSETSCLAFAYDNQTLVSRGGL